MLQDDYEYYRKRSKPELLEALVQLTDQQKRNGELDAASMRQAYDLLAPMLSDAQRRQLFAILQQLE